MTDWDLSRSQKVQGKRVCVTVVVWMVVCEADPSRNDQTELNVSAHITGKRLKLSQWARSTYP